MSLSLLLKAALILAPVIVYLWQEVRISWSKDEVRETVTAEQANICKGNLKQVENSVNMRVLEGIRKQNEAERNLTPLPLDTEGVWKTCQLSGSCRENGKRKGNAAKVKTS